MSKFDNVSVDKKANVYFAGKCVSHTVVFADGTRKSIGVIFPSTLSFNTGVAETMELNAGKCRVRLKNEREWKSYGAGEKFSVPADSVFDIETTEMLDYVCHFGS
jgi:purine/pyrimidine-nucleoside phosphorylase